jgi:hypothetical protein
VLLLTDPVTPDTVYFVHATGAYQIQLGLYAELFRDNFEIDGCFASVRDLIDTGDAGIQGFSILADVSCDVSFVCVVDGAVYTDKIFPILQTGKPTNPTPAETIFKSVLGEPTPYGLLDSFPKQSVLPTSNVVYPDFINKATLQKSVEYISQTRTKITKLLSAFDALRSR